MVRNPRDWRMTDSTPKRRTRGSGYDRPGHGVSVRATRGVRDSTIGITMSTIPGLERPAPVANELTKPFWDACNERRLVLQNCAACKRLHYPPTQKCSKCGSGDLAWKEVKGKGRIDVYF